MGSKEHIPVLLGPVLEGLDIKKDGFYVDGTFGRGGHSIEILKRLNSKGRLLGIDRDPNAIASAPIALINDPRFELIKGESGNLKKHIMERSLQGEVDGLLFDLGVSSPQLDEAKRGFSFLRDGPLDMRMDRRQETSAADLIENASISELAQIIHDYGEEPYMNAKHIAEQIVANRPFKDTESLAAVIAASSRGRWKRIHPATRTFQALRIAVNDELGQVEALLPLLPKLLKPGGRVGVISFHSLEDRLVKRYFKDQFEAGFEAELMPLTKKPIAGATEDVHNPRSRSAKLRVAVKK